MCASQATHYGLPDAACWLAVCQMLLLALVTPVMAAQADWPLRLDYREPRPSGVRATGGRLPDRRYRAGQAGARLAAARRPLVRANPLLLQLDLVNLILPLGALPVRLEEGRDDEMRVLELQQP